MASSQTEAFSVSLIDESDEEHVSAVPARTPEEALKRMQVAQGFRSGIYSVWNPDDPHGMPLLEQNL